MRSLVRRAMENGAWLAKGMAFVILNGTLVVRDGRFSDALPGKVLRR